MAQLTMYRSILTIYRNILGGGVMALTLLSGGCAPVSSAAPAQADGPRVFFVRLAEGATVSTPLNIKLAAENFTVEPAGEVNPDAGHLHIMIDEPCVEPGQGVPKDEAHLHDGQGQLEAELTLAPGAHTLCLQAADGNHVALAGDGMTQIVSITVE